MNFLFIEKWQKMAIMKKVVAKCVNKNGNKVNIKQSKLKINDIQDIKQGRVCILCTQL